MFRPLQMISMPRVDFDLRLFPVIVILKDQSELFRIQIIPFEDFGSKLYIRQHIQL